MEVTMSMAMVEIIVPMEVVVSMEVLMDRATME
jgi:hypothetical protein